MSQQPLVSIGMPVYNGEKYIRQALDSLLTQDYENFELIISDNSSSDETGSICNKYAIRDKRIKYIRQKENMGAADNFKYVLEKATGEYFMWAAHDDVYELFYIEKLVYELEKLGTSFVAANFEAQYMDENSVHFDFFSEGAPFYRYQSNIAIERIKFILSHNYGNLIYSLYRREILDQKNLIFVQNEIPFLLQIAEKGNWRVLPEIGFIKRTSLPTYRQARWEMTGGFIPHSSRISLRSLNGLTGYHKEALDNINSAIALVNISEKERSALISLAGNLIWKHWFWLLIGYKPRPF